MAKNAKEEKIYYSVTMTHNEESLEKLSRMQYDIFCKRNLFFRTIIAGVAVVFGVLHFDKFWGILLTAYGCYLLTSKYSSANHTAHKIAKQIKEAKLPFPSSRYSFDDKQMNIYSLNDSEELAPLAYSAVCRLGEDMEYYYIFRDEYGGYMIPKKELGSDEKIDGFFEFIKQKTGLVIANRASPYKRLRAWLKQRENEPYHL